MTEYRVAAYLRLSREDKERSEYQTESNSIHLQKEMICSFIETQDDMELYHIYMDAPVIIGLK